MVNGINLASGSIAGLGASGGGRTVGAETRVDNELVEVVGFEVNYIGWQGIQLLVHRDIADKVIKWL